MPVSNESYLVTLDAKNAEIASLREENKYIRQQWDIARDALKEIAGRAYNRLAASDDLRGL